MKTAILAGIALFTLCSIQAQATIRYVDSVGGENHYQTISSAYDAAAGGDTLLISAGVYNEELDFYKQLVLIGPGIEYGNSARIDGRLYLRPEASGTSLEGMHIKASNYGLRIYAETSGITVKRSMFEGVNYSVVHSHGTDLHIQNCIIKTGFSSTDRACIQSTGTDLVVENTLFAFTGTGWTHVLLGEPASVSMLNSVALGFHEFADLSGSFPMLVQNCIIYDWRYSYSTFGEFPGSSTWEYNASTQLTAPGVSNILLTANPFANYDEALNYIHGTSDLSLDPVNGAPCIDTGIPALQDLDGSPCDLGLYGGLTPFIDSGAPNYPFVSNMLVPGAVTIGQPLQIEATGRIGREY